MREALMGLLSGHPEVTFFRVLGIGYLLGVCAGGGTATPALAAIQEAAKSPVPTLAILRQLSPRPV